MLSGIIVTNQGRQEETHHPTHMFRRLFLDLHSVPNISVTI